MRNWIHVSWPQAINNSSRSAITIQSNLVVTVLSINFIYSKWPFPPPDILNSLCTCDFHILTAWTAHCRLQGPLGPNIWISRHLHIFHLLWDPAFDLNCSLSFLCNKKQSRKIRLASLEIPLFPPVFTKMIMPRNKLSPLTDFLKCAWGASNDHLVPSPTP